MQPTSEADISRYSVGEVLLRTLRFFLGHLDTILVVVALFVVGVQLALFLLVINPPWLGVLVGVAALILVPMWSMAALYWIRLAGLEGRPASISHAYRAVWGWPLLRYLWTHVLIGLGVLLGALFLIVPGIVFYLRYGILSPVVILAEQRSGLDALRRSAELSKSQALGRIWLAIFGAQVALVLPLILIDSFATNVIDDVLTFLGIAIGAIWPTLVYLRRAQRGAAVEEASVRPGPVRALAATVVLVACTVFYTGRAVVEAFWIPAGSMTPTLELGHHVLANRLAYGLSLPIVGRIGPTLQPRRGDVAIFESPQKPGLRLVKRVVALEGDQVEIRDKTLLVNGEKPDEPYAHSDASRTITVRDNFGPVVVPPGKFFALGDNRDHSHDSRYWGFADVEKLCGRAMVIYWSRDRESGTIHWNRIGMSID